MKTKAISFILILLCFSFLTIQSQTYRLRVIPDGSKKFGFVDLSGDLVIDAVYKNAFDFSEEGTAIVFDNQKKLNPGDLANSRLLSVSGEVIADISDLNLYDDPWSGVISTYRGGILRVVRSKTYGGLNSKGEMVVPMIYDELTDFGQGHALGKRKKDYYIVKANGDEKLIEGIRIIYIKPFSEGLAPVEVKGQNFGFMDTLGKMVIEPAYIRTGHFNAGYAWVRTSNNLIGFINKKGDWIAEPQFAAARDFDKESGMAMVRKGTRWGYLDIEGNFRLIESTEKTYEFSEGLAIGKKSGLHGYINNEGEYIIPAIYQEANNFKNGYARVKKDGKWGLIDKKGDWIINPLFKRIWDVVIIN